MSLQLHQQLANRAVVWNWVRHRHDSLEPEHTILIAVHHCSLIRTLAARVLHIVEAFAVRFPYVNLCALHRLASGVLDVAQDQTGFAVGVMGYDGAVGFYLSFVGMERSEDCAFCAIRRLRVVDAVNEEGEAKDV